MEERNTLNVEVIGSKPISPAIVYLVYRTTNLVNGKFYIGIHKTETEDDGYLGSGKLLKLAVKKYGAQHFQREILFRFTDGEAAFRTESQLVEENRWNPLCYNIKEGGKGGFAWINAEGRGSVGRRKGLEAIQKLMCDPTSHMYAIGLEKLKKGRAILTTMPKEVRLRGSKARALQWTGKTHSSETREKMSRLKIGHLNNQFGSRWITNGQENTVIYQNQDIPDGWRLGRVFAGLV